MASSKPVSPGKTKKTSIVLPATKPRNPLVAPAILKKAGKHAPSPGGERKRANDAARKEALASKNLKPPLPAKRQDS